MTISTEPRLLELERLKVALNEAVRQLDQLEACLARRSTAVSMCRVENALANQIVFAMNRLRAVDRSGRVEGVTLRDGPR